MLALIAILLSQTPDHRLFLQPNLPRSSAQALAAFEFAPANGAGMPAACSCTSPVAATGQALTFTRASSGTCLKGNTLADIANGDLVTCSTNEARVMPGGDGTGGLGLLSEGARTNLVLRSQEFGDAAWSNYTGSGGTNPAVTADQAVAPDGTTTADRIQFAATSGSQASMLTQNPLGATGAAVCSVFLKGNGTSGTIDLVKYNNGSGTTDAAACAFVAATWTRCATTYVNAASSTFGCYLGNGSALNGGTSRSAADVFVWGGSGEQAAFASSYIATVGSAVTRAVEVPTFAAAAGAFDTIGSGAATIVIAATGTEGGVLSFGANNRPIYFISGTTRMFDSTTAIQTSAGTAGVRRLWGSWAASSMTATNSTEALTASGAFDGAMQSASTTLEIGYNASGAGSLFGVIKAVCLDPSPTRCR